MYVHIHTYIHIYQRICMYTVQLQRLLCPRLGLSEPIASSPWRQRSLRLWRRPRPNNCRSSPPHRPRLVAMFARANRGTCPSCSIPPSVGQTPTLGWVVWRPHRRPPGRRSGHGSSADEARRDAAERPYNDYAARGSADVRFEAVDSEERPFGSARLGYYRAIRTGGRYQATAGDGADLRRD